MFFCANISEMLLFALLKFGSVKTQKHKFLKIPWKGSALFLFHCIFTQNFLRYTEQDSMKNFCLSYFGLDQDLSYDESLSGQPGAWIVKKIFFYVYAITKRKKNHIEIQNDF